MRTKVFWRAFLFGGVSALLLVACATPSAPPTPSASPGARVPTPVAAPKKLDRIKLQLPGKAATHLATYLGKEKGIFKEEGLDIEIFVIKATLGFAALLAGEVDYTGSASDSLQASWMGAPVKTLVFQQKKGVWHIFGGPGVNTGDDLKGKRVAVGSIGAAAYFSTRDVMRYLKLDPDKDVTFVAIPGEQQLAALKTGSVAAAALFSPYHIIAQDQGYKELAFTGDVSPIPSSNGISATEKRIKENRDQVKRMVRATLRNMAYIRDNPAESMEKLITEFELERRLAPGVYEDVIRPLSFDGTLSSQGLQALLDMAKATGQVKGDVSVDKAIDLSILKEVQQELKITP